MTNCKNCGGTRNEYDCKWCGTQYKPMLVVYAPENLSMWKRFCNWFQKLFRKEKPKQLLPAQTNNKPSAFSNLSPAAKTAIIIGGVGCIMIIGLMAYAAHKKKVKNE